MLAPSGWASNQSVQQSSSPQTSTSALERRAHSL